MIHSFLMVGQSNMAGRGYANEVEPIDNTNLLVLRNGRWQKLFTPVNPDRRFSGLSLVESFALEYSKTHGDVKVGLIPCADGGTDIDDWVEGGVLFDNAIYQTRLADRTSNIAGILWHQGESDAKEGRVELYEEKLRKVISAFRKEKALKDIPFIMGELGKWDRTGTPWDDKLYKEINDIIVKVASTTPNVSFASSNGLTSNEDLLHINAKSLREFGRRYFNSFSLIEDKDKKFIDKPREDGAIRNALSEL